MKLTKRSKKSRKREQGSSGRAKLIALGALAFVTVLLISLRAAANKEVGEPTLEAAVRVVSKDTLRVSDATLADMGTIKAAAADFPETLEIQGNISVVENLLTVVPSRVGNARVDEVLKVTGETVSAGEPLALLYSPDYISAREEYLQIQLQQSMGNAEGGADLQGFAEVARKKLEMMGLSEQDIANLSKTGDRMVVRALRDGVITSVNTMVGNIQNLGDTLFTTANLDKVWYSGDLYIQDLTKVHKGQTITINAEGLDRPLRGSIFFISPVVDANVRTVKVRAMIDNPGHILRAAMFVQGTLVLHDDTALVVPKEAILMLNDKTYCFKSVGQNRFQEVEVTVRNQGEDKVGIVKGLAPGDVIVATDPATLDHALDAGRTND
jgi:Cu(I)/Ag(I) efflux system membrane fusion protein